jgi:hypothetical protein
VLGVPPTGLRVRAAAELRRVAARLAADSCCFGIRSAAVRWILLLFITIIIIIIISLLLLLSLLLFCG